MFSKKETEQPQEEMTTAALKNDLRRFANIYKAAEKGLEMAAKLETLENSIALRQEEEKQARVTLQQTHDAITDAEAALQQTKDSAAQVTADAEAKAKDIEAQAHAAGEKLLADTEASLNGVKADIDMLTARRDELQAQADSLEAQIAEANKTIDNIQSQAARVLGGLPKGAS